MLHNTEVGVTVLYCKIEGGGGGGGGGRSVVYLLNNTSQAIV